MPLTSTGLTIRRASEWNEWFKSKLIQNLNFTPSFREEDPLTQIVSIWATASAITHEDVLAVYQSMDLDQAEGTSLDREARRMGVTRNGASYTAGFVRFYGNNNITIPADTRVQNPFTSKNFLTTTTSTLTSESCDAVVFTPAEVVAGTVYSITVNNLEVSYTALAGDTKNDINIAIVNIITGSALTGVSAGNDVSTDTLRIFNTDEDKVVTTDVENFTITSVEIDIPVQATEVGAINGQQYSVNTLVTPLGGVTKVQNLEALGLGREREQDAELRARVIGTLEQAGGGTTPAMYAGILDISEVSSVFILENLTDTIDSNGVPPYSIKIIVVAPDTPTVNNTIAKAIYDNRPVGRRTVGDVTITVTEEGEPYPISFSRPSEQPIAMRITGTLNPEQEYPVDGDSKIEAAIIKKGGSLGVGYDVLPWLFYGAIDDAVTGIRSLNIEIQPLTTSGDTPIPGNWTTAFIPINASTSSTYAAQDIIVSIV